MNIMKKIILLLVLALVLFSFTGCAADANELRGTVNQDGETANFWMGIWHGIIAPFAFIISLFKDSIGIYETHNNGGWYNFGFLIGLSIIMGGSGHGSGRSRRRRD